MRDLLIQSKNEMVMSSLEIAELTGKQHKNVLADIRKMLAEIHSAEKSAQYKDSTGRSLPMLLLDKKETLCLVSGYSIKLRMVIINRWEELESQQHQKIPQTYSEALQLAADQAKALELAKPKVEYFDRVVERSNLLNASQVAQKLGLSAIKLNRHLDAIGVYNKNIKRGRVFQQWFIDNGYGELKQTELGYPQAMFTPAGEAWVIEKIISEGIV